MNEFSVTIELGGKKYEIHASRTRSGYALTVYELCEDGHKYPALSLDNAVQISLFVQALHLVVGALQ